MSASSERSLSAAIVFASVIIAASLIFFGIQLGGSSLSDDALAEKISQGIDDYVNGKVRNVNEDDDPVIGDKNAPVTIVEFSDYECPFCQRFYNETYSQIKENYIDTGIAKLVYRDFPLGSHPNAVPAAAAAECARDQGDDETYFEFHDALFEAESLNIETYESIANELGIDASAMTACMETDATLTEILADLNEGKSYRVSGTPSFLINGNRLEGAQPFSEFERVINIALEELE